MAERKVSEAKKFAEVCNGYGFERVELCTNEWYCDGCCGMHDRRTHCYSDTKERLCQFQVVRLYEQMVKG